MRLSVVGELNGSLWESLLKACHPCLSGNDNELELDLSSAEWSPPSGLVPLTSLLVLLKSRGVNVSVVEYPIPKICSYYCRMDFFENIGVHSPCEHKRNSSSGRFIEIKALHTAELAEEVREQLALLLEPVPEATDNSRSSFIDACGELVSNIRHAYEMSSDSTSDSNPSALIQAQYYPKLSQIEFCVCDCGKGIKRSLEETDSQGFSSDLDAIAAALALRNRNESEDGAGLGLAALATYIRKSSNGTFTIRTGDAIKTLKRNTVTATEQLEYWQGTIITLRLNVEDDTDLSQIWERMAR